MCFCVCPLRYANVRWGKPLGDKGRTWLENNPPKAPPQPPTWPPPCHLLPANPQDEGYAGMPFPPMPPHAGMGVVVPPRFRPICHTGNGTPVVQQLAVQPYQPRQANTSQMVGFQMGMVYSQMSTAMASMQRQIDLVVQQS